MITRIQIRNVNAIDFCDINFCKSKYKYLDNMIYNDKVVNPVAFYGSNGSGKSSFFQAINHVISLLINEPKDFHSFIPNNLNAENHLRKDERDKIPFQKSIQNLCSSVTIFFEINKKEYEYFIETSLLGNITNEFLKCDGSIIFNRELESYEYNDKNYETKTNIYPTLRRLASDLQDDIRITESFDFLSNIAYVDAFKQYPLSKNIKEQNYLDLIVEKSEEVNELLKEYKEFPLYTVYSAPTSEGSKRYSVNIEAGDRVLQLPYGLISGGMKSQSLLLSILLSLPENGVLFVDEIEDALHPLTILDFIKVAKDRNIQLIFSSHNTYLLQKLRPDQIFFANWKNGYSTYRKLSDIYPNIREINNIEKMYFSNLFDEEIKNG